MRTLAAALCLFSLHAFAADADPRAWTRYLTTPNARFFVQRSSAVLYSPHGVFQDSAELVTLSCTDDHQRVPAKVSCDPDSKLPDELKSLDASLRRCAPGLKRRAPTKDELSSTLAQLPWGRSGDVSNPSTVMIVAVNHLTRERIYENECSHVQHVPCDPVSSWTTGKFSTATQRTLEVVTATSRGPLQLPFAGNTWYLPYPLFGHREDGWFLPDPVFDDLFDGAGAASALPKLLQRKSSDPDEQLALQLASALAALQANDDRAPALATAFLEALKARPLAKLHRELRPTVFEALPLMRDVAAGRLTTKDPCPAQ